MPFTNTFGAVSLIVSRDCALLVEFLATNFIV